MHGQPGPPQSISLLSNPNLPFFDRTPTPTLCLFLRGLASPPRPLFAPAPPPAPMATPAQIQPPQNPTNTIKSAARKLPIKRKTPPLILQFQSQSQSQSPIPTSIDPTPIPISNPDPSLDSSIVLSNNTAASYDDEFDEDEDDDFDGESQDQEAIEITISAPGTNGAGGDHLKPPPFKFHRIWSEPDEIRFLQGLLGCWSQGLVFPRDLNAFYDRFSESMPQPYTRSQLSEKLRRLRKKFRVMSARIARGQDPNRLAPHDRDLLHLCTRLWDPQYASTSPFLAASDAGTAAAAPAAGISGNKRRRRNPGRPKVEDVAPPPTTTLALPAPPANGLVKENEAAAVTEEKAVPMAIPSSVGSMGKDEEVGGYVAAKTVLDVFDGSLEELRMSLKGSDGSNGNELTRRWQEQRIAELDVFARRLRLMLEQSLNN